MTTEREVRRTDRHGQIVAVLDERKVGARSDAPQQAVREGPSPRNVLRTDEELDRPALAHERLDDERAPRGDAAIDAERVENGRDLPAHPDARDAVAVHDLGAENEL